MSILLRHVLNLTGVHKYLHILSMPLSPTVAGILFWLTLHPFHILSAMEARKVNTCLPDSLLLGVAM